MSSASDFEEDSKKSKCLVVKTDQNLHAHAVYDDLKQTRIRDVLRQKINYSVAISTYEL